MPEIRIGKENSTMFIQVLIKGTWEISLGLLEHCQRAIDEGVKVIIVDLSECEYLDSTFCGMLVEISSNLKKVPDSVMKIFGITGRVYATMQELGLLRFFPVVSEDKPPFAVKTNPLATRIKTQTEQAKHVLRAHESLISIDADNEVKFADCINQLRSELDEKDE